MKKKSSPDPEVIKNHFRSMHFFSWKGEIKMWVGGGLVGWLCAAPSEIRKQAFTIPRIQEEINNYDLPLEIRDMAGHHFKIMIK